MENQVIQMIPTPPTPLVTPPAKKEPTKSFKSYVLSIVTPFEKTGAIYGITIGSVWLLLLLAAWTQAPALIPGPKAVFVQLGEFLTDPGFYSEIANSLWLTVSAMFLSILLASMLSYLSTTKLFAPVAKFLVKIRYMSLMGFIFTFTLVLHSGGHVKTALLMFGIVPFFTLSLLSVISRIQEKEYDLWTTLRYNRWEQLFQVVIYGKLDYLIEAIRANFAMAWLMITLVESFSMADGGIGVMLFRFNKYNQLEKIFALQIVVFCLGIGFDYGLQQLRYAAFPHTKLAEKK